HENLRRRDDLPSGGMMLADESPVVAQFIEPFDQLQIALESQRRVFTDTMERGHENAEFHDASFFAGQSAARTLNLRRRGSRDKHHRFRRLEKRGLVVRGPASSDF